MTGILIVFEKIKAMMQDALAKVKGVVKGAYCKWTREPMGHTSVVQIFLCHTLGEIYSMSTTKLFTSDLCCN